MAMHEHGLEPRREAGCSRPDLAVRIVDWDDVPAALRAELERHAGDCAECGPKLEHLQRAQVWLEGQALPRPTGVCPSADELYDFGRGPGARRRSEAERLSLRAHAAACAECSKFLRTLEQRPPSPVLFEVRADELRATSHQRRRLQLLIPLAAAAAVAAIFVWRGANSATGDAAANEVAAARIRFPTEVALRGTAPSELWYPRERVLASAAGLWAPLVFELAPREHASSYRVTLLRHDGGAFAAGVEVARFEGAAPLLSAPPELERALAAGHYTWEAWAGVDGLEVALGRRDFEVVLDEALVGELAARDRAPEPTRSEALLHLLHDAGFDGDARSFARTLAPSAERDAFLARRPGR